MKNKMLILFFIGASYTAIAQTNIQINDSLKKFKSDFLSSCIKSANKNTSILNSTTYCTCIFDLITSKFKQSDIEGFFSKGQKQKFEDSIMHLFHLLSNKSPNELNNCIGSSITDKTKPWSEKERKVFLAGCKESFQTNTELSKTYHAEKYCSCLMENVEGKYSDKELMEIKTNPVLLAIARECLKKSKRIE